MPSLWAARAIAENVRLDYAGNFPASASGIELQLPDGTAWRLRPIPGPEPPPKRRGFVGWIVGWIVEIKRMRGTAKFARWEVTKMERAMRIAAPF